MHSFETEVLQTVMLFTFTRSPLKKLQRFLSRNPAPYRFLRKLISPPQSIFQHLHFVGEIKVKIDRSRYFRMMSHGHSVENNLFWCDYGKGREGVSLELWRDLAIHCEHIVDIGANSGVYALAAKASNPTARVMAVEPSSIMFSCLEENIALNGFDILALKVAASDRNATVQLHDFPGSHQYSASLEEGFREGSVPVDVEAVRLDDLFEQHDFKVDMLKMDVEGHEPSALRGMRRTLEEQRPILLLEVLNQEADRAIGAELAGLGYQAHPLGDGNVVYEALNADSARPRRE